MKPILFSTNMIQAILAGNKTQTRRIVKFPKDYDGKAVFQNYPFGLKYSSNEFDGCVHRLFPRWEVGDILWVRETWQRTDFLHVSDENYGYVYKASENGREWEANDESWKWRPSIFMPKEACRIWLEVTDVRAERLQDISRGDAMQEGCPFANMAKETSPCVWFSEIWEKINGNWNENPWVWCISFKRL